MFRFQLVALSGKKFDEEVYEVILPTLDGEIGVLEQHMPLVSVAMTGAIIVKRTSKDTSTSGEIFAISGGVIEVKDNTLRVLVDEADHADELNEAEVQKALERALKMKSEAKDQISLDNAQNLVDRQGVRLQVAGLKKHSKRKY